MQVLALMAFGWLMIIGVFLCELIGEGVVIFILHSLVWCIFIAVFISIMTKKPGKIHGSLSSYSTYKTLSDNSGIVKKGTFYTKDNTRHFYKKIHFEKNLWSSDSKPLDTDCIFFVDFSKYLKSHLSVWGVLINDRYWVFKDDMKRSMYAYFIVWAVSISELWLLYFMFMGTGKRIHIYLPLAFFSFLAFVFTTLAFLKDKKLYKERLQLLESEGVPHPLG